jgi:hypothetical protein
LTFVGVSFSFTGVTGTRRTWIGKRMLVVSSCIALTALGAGGIARAGLGGAEPSSAPNLSEGQHPFSSCFELRYEMFALPSLRNGDRVVITFNNTDYLAIKMLPPKSDDYNWEDQSALSYAWQNGTNKGRMIFDAGEGDGRYLIYVDCRSWNDAYDFVVESIRHILRIDYVDRPATIPRKGTFRAQVVNGNGGHVTDPNLRLTLFASYSGSTHVVASASPADGVASFSYQLPASLRGKKIVMWVAASAQTDWLGANGGKFRVGVR